MATTKMFGASIKRREDPRFITGKGNYTDDVKLPGMTYAAFVRSPHAHARITGIDVSAALEVDGVVAEVAVHDRPGFAHRDVRELQQSDCLMDERRPHLDG